MILPYWIVNGLAGGAALARMLATLGLVLGGMLLDPRPVRRPRLGGPGRWRRGRGHPVRRGRVLGAAHRESPARGGAARSRRPADGVRLDQRPGEDAATAAGRTPGRGGPRRALYLSRDPLPAPVAARARTPRSPPPEPRTGLAPAGAPRARRRLLRRRGGVGQWPWWPFGDRDVAADAAGPVVPASTGPAAGARPPATDLPRRRRGGRPFLGRRSTTRTASRPRRPPSPARLPRRRLAPVWAAGPDRRADPRTGLHNRHPSEPGQVLGSGLPAKRRPPLLVRQSWQRVPRPRARHGPRSAARDTDDVLLLRRIAALYDVAAWRFCGPRRRGRPRPSAPASERRLRPTRHRPATAEVAVRHTGSTRTARSAAAVGRSGLEHARRWRCAPWSARSARRRRAGPWPRCERRAIRPASRSPAPKRSSRPLRRQRRAP